MTAISNSLVSVVVEGFNESRDLGAADATMAALENQTYPTNRIEIILVGSHDQAENWKSRHESDTSFHNVLAIGFEDIQYYDLKNQGMEYATGDIIALTDSDVVPLPGWVEAFVQTINDGADISVGPSLFGNFAHQNPRSLLMTMTASIPWGWIFGKADAETGLPVPRGFMDHNLAMRSDIARQFKYETEFGRVIAAPLLFANMTRQGKKFRSTPGQKAVHSFTWRYWMIDLQYRYGYEVYHIRRLEKDYPHRWMAKTSFLEPIVTLIWHMLLDIPKWIRMNKMIGNSWGYRILILPIYICISFFGRICEMFGMYATYFWPKRMRMWVDSL